MVDGDRLYGPSRANADEASADVRGMRERGRKLAAVDELVDLEEGMRLALQQGERLGASQGTLRFYREAFKPLWRHFGGKAPLHAIDLAAIDAYRQARLAAVVLRCRCKDKNVPCSHEGRRVTNRRVEKELTALGRIFSVAIRAKRFPGQNPVRDVERARIKPTEAPFYTADDVSELVAALRATTSCPSATWFADVVALLFLSGLRLGELSHLRSQDADFQRGLLSVPAEGKTGARLVPFSKPLRAVLKRLLHGKSSDSYLLPGPSAEKRAMNLKSNVFPRFRKRLPERLKRGFFAHALRHSFKSHLENQGVPRAHSDALTGHGPARVHG